MNSEIEIRLICLLERFVAAAEKQAGVQQKRSAFCPAEPSKLIYCNSKHAGFLWYFWDDETSQPQEVCPAGYGLACVPESLEKIEKEYKGKPVLKVRVHCRAADGAKYVLEMGRDAHFEKSLVAALATLSHAEIQRGIVIAPQAGNEEGVVFARVLAGGQQVMARYDENTNFDALRILTGKAVSGNG